MRDTTEEAICAVAPFVSVPVNQGHSGVWRFRALLRGCALCRCAGQRRAVRLVQGPVRMPRSVPATAQRRRTRDYPPLCVRGRTVGRATDAESASIDRRANPG